MTDSTFTDILTVLVKPILLHSTASCTSITSRPSYTPSHLLRAYTTIAQIDKMDTFFANAFYFNDVPDHLRQHSLSPTHASGILDDVQVHLQFKDDETFITCCICQGDMAPTGDLSICRSCLHYECDSCTTAANINTGPEDKEEPAIALQGRNLSEYLGDRLSETLMDYQNIHRFYPGNPFYYGTSKEVTPVHPGHTKNLSFPNYPLHLNNHEVGYPKNQIDNDAPIGVGPKDTVSVSQLEIDLLKANSHNDFGQNELQQQERIHCCKCNYLMEKFVHALHYCRDDDHFECCDCKYESIEHRHLPPTSNQNFHGPKKYVLSRNDYFEPVKFIELRNHQHKRNQSFRVSKHYVLSQNDTSKSVEPIKPSHRPYAGKQNFRTPNHNVLSWDDPSRFFKSIKPRQYPHLGNQTLRTPKPYVLSRDDPSRSVFGLALLE